MFTSQFTVKQKAIFLDLIDQLIMADGIISPYEKAKMQEFQSAFPDITAERILPAQLADSYPTRRDRVGVMLELLSIAMEKSDPINENDAAFLTDLCNHLRLSEADMSWMRLWVGNMLFLIRNVSKFGEE